MKRLFLGAAVVVCTCVALATPVVDPVTTLIPVNRNALPEAKDGQIRSTADSVDHSVAPAPVKWAIKHQQLINDHRDRQRIKIRNVFDTPANTAPFIYPPFHWIPTQALTQMDAFPEQDRWILENWIADIDANGHQGQESDLPLFFSLLNIQVYPQHSAPWRPDPNPNFANSEAMLTFELTHGEFTRTFNVKMRESEEGVYRFADPYAVADDVFAELNNLNVQPVMSIVSLRGVEYDAGKMQPFEAIGYAVRWSNLELEYGNHASNDPAAVIR